MVARNRANSHLRHFRQGVNKLALTPLAINRCKAAFYAAILGICGMSILILQPDFWVEFLMLAKPGLSM